MKQTGIGCVSISSQSFSQSCRVCVCCRFLNYESKTFNVEIREGFKVGGKEGIKNGRFFAPFLKCVKWSDRGVVEV